MNKGNTKKGLRITSIPYFDDWTLWRCVMDNSDGHLHEYIANAVVMYLTDAHNAPTSSTHKAYWDALCSQAMKEGITIPICIQRSCIAYINKTCSSSPYKSYEQPISTPKMDTQDKHKGNILPFNPFNTKKDGQGI